MNRIAQKLITTINKLVFLCIFSGSTTFVVGQIAPPVPTCLKADTLFWKLPTNACGPFVSFLIFHSTNANGPFTLLTTITNPNQIAFKHSGAAIGSHYYYMQSNYNCPGFLPINSDTISNGLPPKISISSVSVQNGFNVLNWVIPTSSRISYFIVFKSSPVGTIPIDTILGNSTTYTDITSNPSNSIEYYYVNSMDDCGNVSLYDKPHNNILPTFSTNKCEKSLTIRWNKYNNWPLPIDAHEIWAGINGSVLSKIGKVAGTDTVFKITNIDPRSEYCILVKANSATKDIYSDSDTFCIRPVTAADFSYFTITNVSVGSGNSVYLSWIWDPTAVILTYTIERKREGAKWESIYQTSNPILTQSNVFVDTKADPVNFQYEYRITASNDCSQTSTSNVVSTIKAYAVSFPSSINKIYWIHPSLQSTIVGYNIYYVTIDTLGNIIAGTGSSDTKAQHDISNEPASTVQFCYWVEAISNLSTPPNGAIVEIISRSPIICVNKLVDFYIPNAFKPGGVNDRFLPYTQNPELIIEFLLEIYDRWGDLIYSTKSFDEGWNGIARGKEAPVGVYTYLIKSVQVSGRKIDKVGTVTLLR